jgi:hypothetical protein
MIVCGDSCGLVTMIGTCTGALITGAATGTIGDPTGTVIGGLTTVVGTNIVDMVWQPAPLTIPQVW